MSPERPVVSLGTHSWGSCFPAGSMWEEKRHRPFASHCHVLLPQPDTPGETLAIELQRWTKCTQPSCWQGLCPPQQAQSPTCPTSCFTPRLAGSRLQWPRSMMGSPWGQQEGHGAHWLREGWGPGQRVQRWHQCSALQSRSREAEAWLCMLQGAGRALVWVVREALTPWGSSNLWPSRCPAGAR